MLPHIINAVIITSASSSANAFLKQAPLIFLKCTSRGIPIYGIAFTTMWSGLAYMSVSAGASEVFSWFLTLGTIAALFTWCSITIAYLRFRQALAKQGVDRNTLVFKSKFQPYIAWFALCYFAMIILFSGWEVFTKGNWSVQGFITYYLGIPVYFGFKAALDATIWPE
ncbi:uncharacterized protein BDZ99DRAFT_488881 [Mytilinidion resinicola]|uniref:Amino acid permease/ SLC12A domain-containing protein n=1 Tax=Mytilinidion resinicola TaxID=574789 RepID=A0A6A6YK68_9PEZI|nr:uncharacterized protein BDZ99DRAFT_488881 [Mytilinidion resinicola]KAF2809180.1 hypothetical protein BDZ99DRAFT_488881 [Mytilinidion resinicola]